MKQQFFDEAMKAYEAKDFETALKGFQLATDGDPTPNGKACQMAGNSLLKLRRFGDAVTMYRRALADPTFADKGQTYTNLGTALAGMGEYAQAIGEFTSAVETGYPGAYRAYSGMGNAYMKIGKIEEAGIAYRTGALYEGNPDPGKMLVNLGICFMMLGRPNDAVESYKAALSFPTYKTPGKAFANLGQAYTAAGRMPEAVSAFERATENYGQALSPAAQTDFEKAMKVTAGQGVEIDDPAAQLQATAAGAAVGATGAVPAGAAATNVSESVGAAPYAQETTPAEHHTSAMPPVEGGTAEAFFSQSDEDVRRAAREEAKESRRENKTWLRVLIAVALVLVILAASGAAAYFLGFGYPSQTSTIESMMDTYASGGDVSEYWVANPDVDVVRQMLTVPQTSDVTIDSVEKGPSESSAIVTMKLDSGATLSYTVTLDREGLGWKVADIQSYFPAGQ